MSTPTDYQTDSSIISGTFNAGSGSFGGSYFTGERDKEFFHDITNELIKKICNQRVFIYQVDWEKTTTNMYGESTEKVYKDPTQTWGRIMYNDPIQNLNSFSYDTKYNIQIEFYSKMLDAQDIKLREGDCLRLGVNSISTNSTLFLEITNLVYVSPLHGQTDVLLDMRAICTTARQSLVSILSRDQTVV